MGCDGVGVLSRQEGLESSGDLSPQRVVGLWKITIFLLFLIASNIRVFYNKHLLLSNFKKNPYFPREEKKTQQTTQDIYNK